MRAGAHADIIPLAHRGQQKNEQNWRLCPELAERGLSQTAADQNAKERWQLLPRIF